MEPTPLLLLLSLGWTCSGRLTVLPQEPLVQIGGSIQLNCSLDCPDGTPQWKGLDTNLGNIISTPTYSLLLITNAAVAMEGTKFCVGNCQGKSHQGSTNLQVYSGILTLTKAECLEEELTSAASPTAELTSAESPTTEFIVTSHKPSAKATSVHWLVTTETLATESRAASQHPSAGTVTTDWSPSSASSSATENPTTGDVASTENPLTKKATSDRSPRTESVCNLQIRPVPPKGTTGEALKIICEAECGENVTIRWLKTPVVLSQYQEEASEGKSTLTVDRVGLDHQGIYECIMLSRRLQVARLHIAVSAAIFSTDSAIVVGTASSLLGLIVTAFASHRLWRRLHPPGMKSPKGNSV
ncbi:mucosal addressin cell adhesion molecule 1 [Terrapene carolina triunguis]|uniref:mucosal addressin cell adhesion molecule 1 n=1 Tax=Terrapene triunguis TaxID=2587831 RepID=UPI000E77E754|nr:mucosal addressin cell adhesion molecule 1 [Terrapene carolina triunguis]